MSQAFYRKYRPQGWDEVIGQAHVVQTLRNAVINDRVAHAYLFAGPRGTGKTTLARLLAKAVNCLHEDRAQRPCNHCEFCRAVNEGRFLDLIEIDAASNTSVEDVRDLRDKINFAPTQGKYKVYIIDEVHMLSTAAFNALLKTLEEPPSHAIFVLATTEIHKIPATVLSRCQRHEFRRVPVDEIVGQLRQIAQGEGILAEDEALTWIARMSTGSVRDAISLLDQLASTGEAITVDLVQTVLGTAASQTVLDLVEAIVHRQAARGLEVIHRALDAGVDSRALARQVVEYLRGVLLIQMGNEAQVDASREVKRSMAEQAAALSVVEVIRLLRVFNQAATELRSAWQPALSLELALAEALEQPAPSSGPPAFPGSVRSPAMAGEAGRQASATAAVKESSGSAEPVRGPQEASEEKPSVALAEVMRVWKQVQAVVKTESVHLAALLNSVRSLDMQGNTLVLGFASEVLRSKMKAEEIERTRRALASVLGVTLDVRCEVIPMKGKIPPQVPQDGMVAAALRQGGEIVDTQEM